MELDFASYQHLLFNTYTLIVVLLIIITGVILGFKELIVVYRDYDDLGIAFSLVLSPIVLLYLFSFTGSINKISGTFVFVVELSLFAWLLTRTYQDNNNNIIFTLLAAFTKVSLSILFILNLLQLVSPTGKTTSQRVSSRRSAFAILLLISPLVFALVKNKVGIFNPARTLSRRGVSF
jgi:hypothetical protein